jgi:uncharacterized phage protein (TIGR01671 family)
MREIKFRAWEKDLKEMVYENELCGYVEYDANPVKAINLMLNGECEDYIFMQYVGLKDKNDKEIYEGDVVNISEHPFDKSIKINGNYEVGYNDVMELCAGSWLLYRVRHWCEVIGNIHEHPHLLKGDN